VRYEEELGLILALRLRRQAASEKMYSPVLSTYGILLTCKEINK
jgi:hypothetical protein